MSRQLRSTSRQRGQRSNRRPQTFQRTQRTQRPAFKNQGSRRSTGGINILTSSYSSGIEELKGHYSLRQKLYDFATFLYGFPLEIHISLCFVWISIPIHMVIHMILMVIHINIFIWFSTQKYEFPY